MKRIKRIICFVLTAVLVTSIIFSAYTEVYAKYNSSIIFDVNEDKVSDEKDIQFCTDLVSNSGFFPVQSVIYGGLSSTDYDTAQADSIPRYFLTNVNLTTTPKYQKPLGDCWAFSAVGVLESAALKAENLIVNPDNKIDPKAFSEPVLSGLSDKIDISERAVVWFVGEPLKKIDSPSQAGEGNLYKKENDNRFYAGGMGSYSENLFTAWRGVLTEKSAPHLPDGWNGTIKNLDTNKNWALPADLSAQSYSSALRVSEYLLLPSTSKFNFDKEKAKRSWQEYNYKSRSIVKQMILDYGAVGTDYDSGIDSVSSSFYTDKTTTMPNHAVTIVGWDDNYSKDNFHKDNSHRENKPAPTEDGAWLVKNNWGSYDYLKSIFKNWDEDREGLNGMTYKETVEYAEKNNTTIEKLKQKRSNTENKYLYEFGIRDNKDRGTGYFWIYYCDRSMGMFYTFKADIAADGYDYDNNYQYDYAVCNDDLKFSLRTADTDTLVSNVFTAKGNEKLKAFSAYTNETDSVVKTDIYLINKSISNPTQGKLVYSTEDKVKFAGFHTIKLKKDIALSKGQKFAIVQNIRSYNKGTNSDVSYLNLETVFTLASKGASGAKSNVVCNDGETFVRLDGNWTTPKELNNNLDVSKILTFGNAKIKAFTTNIPKKKNPIKVNAKSKTINSKTLKKKTKRFKAVVIKNAQGKVNCKLIKKGSTSKVFKKAKINSQGVISIKKCKLKKGNYKLKVRVTANGNNNYASANKVVTVKIKVK